MRWRVLLGIVLLVGVVAFSNNTHSSLLNTVWQVDQVIKKEYLHADEISEKTLFYGALRGMVQALNDPYSRVLTPSEYDNWNESFREGYVGVGIEIAIREGRFVVVTSLPGSPAEEAGISTGDTILAIDGESVKGWPLEKLASKIRGPEGTAVMITVLSHGDKKNHDVQLRRQKIKVESMYWRYMADVNVGYIRIARFDVDTPDLLSKALHTLPLESISGLIIDLRNNPGGLLGSAVKVASCFIDSGVIVRTFGPSFHKRTYWSYGNEFPSLPLAFLTNEGTASAAELLAGAIQDHKVGVVIGRTTFGKGLIQSEVLRFGDGGVLILTIGEYLTPLGHTVQGRGITPDIKVEANETTTADPDLAAALEWIRSHQ